MHLKRLLKKYFVLILFLLDKFLNLFRKKKDIECLLTHARNILVIDFCRIGDIICLTPFLQELKRTFKNTKVAIVSLNKTSDILKHNPYVDEIISIKNTKHIFEWINLFFKLRKKRYDIVFNPVWMLKSSFLAVLLFPKFIIGYINDLSFTAKNFNSHQVEYCGLKVKNIIIFGQEENIIDRGLKILSVFKNTPFERKPELFFDDTEIESFRYLISDRNRIKIAIHPGSGGKYKLWPIENYHTLITKLLDFQQKIQIILVGGKSELPALNELENIISNNARITNYINKLSLRETAFVLSQCKLFIGSDSGIMHLASTVGLQVIALFGPTIPERAGPFGKSNIIITHRVKCSPCEQIKCLTSPNCMELITADEVFNNIIRITR